MSINNNQRNIINSIVGNENTDYDFCGRAYLNGSSATVAKNLEQKALEDIADKSAAGNDAKIIKAIAEWELQNYDPSDLNKKIVLFILGHRSGYAKDLGGSDEICITANSNFISIARNVVAQKDLKETDRLNEQHNCYCNIGNNIYYIGENNKLFGKDKPYGFAFSTSTAACVYGTNMNAPVSYQGYCFETMRGRTGYATGASIEQNQFFYLTPGGGPLTEDNWIIKFVQYGTRVVDEDDTNTTDSSPWVIKKDNKKIVIVKIWIHLFFPDGSYVRTVLDRSNSADFSGVNSDMSTSWIYRDYANSKATARGLTFSSVWNDYIYNKAYRNIGGNNPNTIDVSLEWNGKHDMELQESQVAYHYLNHTIWSAAKRRQG